MRRSSNCMFDCPAQSQTSPTRTLVKVSVFFPCDFQHTGLPVRRHRFQFDRPVSGIIDRRGELLTLKLNPDHLAGSSGPPERHLRLPLQHHVVGEKRRHLHG
ncbi:MAG: hypothetical protein L6W00_00310 [Lentisphaeria bacterium]|nr:MAG: hypothetical protein L6W00_00310 [Lentisphaeria bacterium]